MNGCKFVAGGKPWKVYLRPKPVLGQADITNGSAIVGVSTSYNPWLNFDNGGDKVPHAGLSVWVTQPGASGSATLILYDVYAKYHFVCRDPR